MIKGNKFVWYSLPLGLVIDKVSTNDKKIKQKEYLVEGKYPVIDQGADFIGGYTNDESKVLRCDLPVIVWNLPHLLEQRWIYMRENGVRRLLRVLMRRD